MPIFLWGKNVVEVGPSLSGDATFLSVGSSGVWVRPEWARKIAASLLEYAEREEHGIKHHVAGKSEHVTARMPLIEGSVWTNEDRNNVAVITEMNHEEDMLTADGWFSDLRGSESFKPVEVFREHYPIHLFTVKRPDAAR